MNNNSQHNFQRQNLQENAAKTNGSSSLDNKEILRLFVQGQSQFIYNEELQVESQMNLATLKTRQGDILGLIKKEKKNRTATIKKSPFLQMIEEALVQSNFVCLGDSLSRKGFAEYKEYEVPSGYKINYTETKILWKIWWPSQNFTNSNQLQLNLLVRIKEQWYPIKNMIVEEGKVYIVTLRGEMCLSINDKVFWLNKLEKMQETEALTAEEQPRPQPKPQTISVAQRYSLIQKLIGEEQAIPEVGSENRTGNNLLIERDELLKQIGEIGKNMKRMNIAHQKQIAELQRKQAEDFNKLWQRLLSVHQKVQRLGINGGEENNVEPPTRHTPEPILNEDAQTVTDPANEYQNQYNLELDVAPSAQTDKVIQDLVKNLS